MNDTNSPISIDYFTDVLCIWAWIAQPRLEELHEQWGDRVQVRHCYVDIFGDCNQKIHGSWGEKDGYEKFAAHVAESVRGYDRATLHHDIWRVVQPRTSMQAHLFLKATGLVAGEEKLAALALRIRHAFFADARDISNIDELISLATAIDIDITAVKETLRNGAALAALSQDQRTAQAFGVKGSPTWMLNEGRQLLYGNVGYRILSANIEELLKHPTEETSWC